jgi:hydroxymethylglutaryl-CoA reductase (NADPH)
VSADLHHASSHLERLLRTRGQEELLAQLTPHTDNLPPKVPGGAAVSAEAIEQRWTLLPASPASQRELLDAETAARKECYKHNIEHFLGTVKVPIGLAGPLRVNGLFAHGDYYVPLATTEAALVASYSRGSHLLSEAGGCTAALLNEGVSRAPGFAFRDLREAGVFVYWATEHIEDFRRAAESTTRFGKLNDLRITIEGNHVFLNFEFLTADASGQNMVTLATEAICEYIEQHSPVRPRLHFVEANLSGDKKASALAFLLVRGRKVCAEAIIPAALVEKRLRTTSEQMVNFWRMSAMGGVLSGTMGLQGHYANGLAALYLACGQDVACVAESAVGVTRFEVVERGGLYASVSLPNIMVGTVGGGTGLPSQKACLDIMGLSGPGKAQALAEVAAGLCLAGELSIMGAICSGDFSRAHRLLARGKQHKGKDQSQGSAHG